MSKKVRIILLVALGALLIVSLTAGFVLAKYTIEWDSGFGIHIYPKKETYILTTGDNLRLKLNDATEHIVFGEKAAYTAEIAGLEKVHVGYEPSDQIHLYYDDATKTAYILADKPIYFNADSSNAFKNMTAVQSITLENINTGDMTSMAGMFEGCSALLELDLCLFDTTNVTDMHNAFANCSVLEVIYDDGGFVTSAVSSSDNMFLGTYQLMGGLGTRVYPVGETETTRALDKTFARVDGTEGLDGFLTDRSYIVYFRSNLLLESAMGASYTINGVGSWFSIANALDSLTYSKIPVRYQLSYQIFKDGAWVTVSNENRTMAANEYISSTYSVTPITVDGVTYDDVKVIAQCLTGLTPPRLEAVFHFNYTPMSVSYVYEGAGAIHMIVDTNDMAGNVTFTWAGGVNSDDADANNILQTAVSGVSKHNLMAHTKYDFYFMIADLALLEAVEADPATQMPLAASVARSDD